MGNCLGVRLAAAGCIAWGSARGKMSPWWWRAGTGGPAARRSKERGAGERWCAETPPVYREDHFLPSTLPPGLSSCSLHVPRALMATPPSTLQQAKRQRRGSGLPRVAFCAAQVLRQRGAASTWKKGSQLQEKGAVNHSASEQESVNVTAPAA